GAKSFRRGVNKVRVPFGAKVLQIIDQYVPTVIVTKAPRTRKSWRLIEAIRKRAKMQKVSVRLLPPKAVDHTFKGHNANKHQIATAIANRFPELLPILPPPRRPWQSEDYRMSIFDAGAVGIAYLTKRSTRDPRVRQ